MFVTDPRLQANASWMEHQILHHVKQALRVTLQWKTPAVGLPRKISSVQFTIKSFQRHLNRVMELEEQDGYMQMVAERKPNLDERIRTLEREHDEFRRRLGELVPRIDSLTDGDHELVEELCEQLEGLLDRIDQHDLQEIELLQETMLCDEGGEG
jgi:hemerythrin-like domain-containing protein